MSVKKRRIETDLIEDDASKYLETLSVKERRQRYGTNGLPQTSGSFSAEERDAAYEIFCPAGTRK